ncbi:MAG: hypothetical protein HC859_09715 [Bacteroidia bacterium]|nr:hypothetical protein [Bacteroidia bacterium]
MKVFSFVHVLLFLLCLLVCKCATAQDYVVTLQNDTLKGEVKPMMFSLTKSVQLAQPDKKKVTYTVIEVKGFRYDNEEYRVVRDNKGYTFMKVLKEGYLSLYAFQPENQNNFDGRFLQKRDGSSLEVPNLSFKKQMSRFLAECEVSDKIDKGELGRRELEQIIDEYNVCIAKNSVQSAEQPAPQMPVVSQQPATPVATSEAWQTLETKVKEGADFEGKSTALEMITEIRSKLGRKEKVPNFMVGGLKETLGPQTHLAEALNDALKELKTNAGRA